MRVHIHDVLAHIAEVSGGYTGADIASAMEEYWQHYPYQLRLSITSDVELTALNYLERFGMHDTVYFSLKDYGHGCQLARELYQIVTGVDPDLKEHDGGRFGGDEKLYLFVHIENISEEGTL